MENGPIMLREYYHGVIMLLVPSRNVRTCVPQISVAFANICERREREGEGCATVKIDALLSAITPLSIVS